MKLPAKSVAWLLPLLLTGCFHKTHQPPVQTVAPSIENVPQPTPAPAPTEPTPPAATVPSPVPVPEISTQPKVTPKRPVHHKKPAPPANTTQQASNGNASVSAIGQLSSGGANDLRQQTLSSIMATERGLNSITRGLNDQEQKTAAQIREFLKQARAALNSDDVDGAHTLSAKARVLLGELGR
jgi:outer membrane biosynthesis protein TonB